MYYNSGNVGIGTSTPAYKLDVSGTFRAATSTFNGTVESTSGGFKFPDGTTQTTKTPSFRGALVYKTADQSYTANATAVATWDAESYDTNNIHDNSTNNSRLTVPSGVTKVRLIGNLYIDGTASTLDFSMRKNGSGFIGNAGGMIAGTSYTNFSIVSAPIDVVAGDYFEIFGRINATLNLKVSHTGFNQDQHYSSFAMEIIE